MELQTRIINKAANYLQSYKPDLPTMLLITYRATNQTYQQY